MLIDKVKRDIRLLERLAIFDGLAQDVPGVPGTPEYLFLSVLKNLRLGRLDEAKQEYKELAGVLRVPPDSQQLEPLRTIFHLKLWDGGPEDRQQLQKYLIKEMGVNFEAEPPLPKPLHPPTAAPQTPDPALNPTTPQLPTSISPDQYSTTAFLKLLNPTNTPSTKAHNHPINTCDPSRLHEVIADPSIPIKDRISLLKPGSRYVVPPAVLSVEVLVKVVQEWLNEDAKQSWNCRDAMDWVTGHWDEFTAEQAGALRAILPGPRFGANPPIDRPYIVALVNKALAAPPAAAAAGGGGSSEVAPWACGAAAAAALTDLQRVLEVCDQLGVAADWIRLHAVHAQLLLQQQQEPTVDLQTFITYMKMLGRATWSPGPTVTDNRFGIQQQQQPMHVSCSVCGIRPIQGPRFRSLSQFGFNTCARCAGSEAAAAAAPLEEVRVDDSIYMSPELPLPQVLGAISRHEADRESEARKMLLELVQPDGADGSPEQFTPAGPCPLATAGLLLPKEWRDKAVAEGKLLSGRGGTAAWSRMYQDSKGNVEQLHQQTEFAFATHNKESYTVQEDVTLHLISKNIGQQGVLVKLYEINCWNYYTSERKPVDLNLELSGLTPTKTIHIKTPQNPIIRSHHSVPLGLAGRAGVWLAEVVAGSTRMRARIYKGTLRLVQRPSVAGQVITVMDEDWMPVKDVRVWCDNQEYKSKPDGMPNEVLLPYSRENRSTTLVVAARLDKRHSAAARAGGAGAGQAVDAATTAETPDAQECVVLFPDYERLREQYNIEGQLYCHQESLLPGQTVPLLLQLSLELHGRPAPLKLLQDVTLRVTATTHDGAEVPQVFKDLTADPATGGLQLQYNLPPGARRVSAVLNAKILLALPGINGEPDYQEFELQQLLPGRTGHVASIDINAAAASSNIWDVYLSAQSSSGSSSSSGEPEYLLQVLGRAGEAPAVPKVLSVWMSHVHYQPQHKVHMRVQTGPGGVVNLGPLTGVRHLEAQIESGLDCVDVDNPNAAASHTEGFGFNPAAAGGVSAGGGPTRKWQIARASWWQGGLQKQYTISAGSDLQVPLATASGQTLDVKLLQLLDHSTANINSRSPTAQAIIADISAEHLTLLPAAAAAEASSSSSSASGSAAMLGSSSTAVIKVQGLAPGLYRLLVPALLLELPDPGFLSQGWQAFGSSSSSSSSGGMEIEIRVLPKIEAAAAAAAAAGAAQKIDQFQEDGGDVSSTIAAAAVDSSCSDWLWAGSYHPNTPVTNRIITQPSAASQLHITSFSCSSESGLSIQLSGTPDQLESARIVAIFSRFLPDGSGVAADLLHNKITTFKTPTQDCGGFGVCDYSKAAKLDSAVAYVLQRRQWEADARRGGGLRPGSLLDRPSLLVVPRCVRSAASGTTVLKGGDGQRLQAQSKKQQPLLPHTFAAAPATGFGAAYAYGAPPAASLTPHHACMAAPAAAAAAQGYYTAEPQTPVLSFLANPAAVLTDLEPDLYTGRVELTAEHLQQMLAAAAGVGGTELSSINEGIASANKADISCYSTVYVAAYVPRQPGQFVSARCVVGGALDAEQLAVSANRRDLGLMRAVQEDDILALSCDVLALQPGTSLTLPSDPAAAEAAVYSTSQQLYHLLYGLLEISEAAWGSLGFSRGFQGFGGHHAQGFAGSGGGLGDWRGAVSDVTAVRKVLPNPCPPPQGKGASCSTLLRQWEPLLLNWHQLTSTVKLEMLDKLNSTEAAFYLACKHTESYQQHVLPLLKTKLPSELTCLEQILLLQATHNQPPIPNPAAAATAATASPPTAAAMTATPTAAAEQPDQPAYTAAKQQLLQHWYAPHRYQHLTALERVLLAALEGREALLLLCKDMRDGLKTPDERRGVKRTWMSPDRRPLFDFALLLSKQLEQQQQQEKDDAEDDDAGTEEGAGAEFDDYVHVEYDQLGMQQQQQQTVLFGAAAAPMAAAAAPPPGGGGQFAPPMPKMAMRARAAAADESDLAARSTVAAAALKSARLAPKETQEWAEAGWWKWDGKQTAADIIPVSHFWADFAEHLATNPDQPFIPTDPTGAAASTAAVVAALAVTGLRCDGSSSTAAAAASGSGSSSSNGTGCSKCCNGSTVTLTAKSPCLVWIKQAKSVASITAAAAGSSSSSSSGLAASILPQTLTAGPAGTVIIQGGTSSVLVTERLYDPRFASTTDLETGEQLLLALLPTQQQPLLAGQSYCQSVIITSTGAAEQQLDILVQMPQGAVALADGPSTISKSINLSPYATYSLDMCFYFPEAGVYKRAPASITKRGRPAWMPSSPPVPLYVAAVPAAAVPGTQQQQQVQKPFEWSEFLKTASREQLLDYLRTGDLSAANLPDISPYCRDPTFFNAATSALTNRHTYNHTIWRWAVAHMDATTLQQLLPMCGLAQRAFDGLGVPASNLPLMHINGHDMGVWQLEYWPWVNPYCRPIPRDDGGDSTLPSVLADNPNIAEQWRTFLLVTLFDFSTSSSSSRTSPGGSSSSSTTTPAAGSSCLNLGRACGAAGYLLLQDRVDEAEMLLRQFDLDAAAAALHDGAPLRMQVDYLRAWMALCRPLPAQSGLLDYVSTAVTLGKAVVERYKNSASQPWRKRFTQLKTLIKELEQQQQQSISEATLNPTATGVAGTADTSPEDTAAMLSIVSLDSGQIKIQYRGMSKVTLSAYQINTELLFTTQPFSNLSSSSIEINSNRFAASRMPADTDRAADTGLGKVAFVQPSARILLQLEPATAAAAAGLADSAAAAAGVAPATAVFDLDALLPELRSQSVLLEVSGGGISRTVPRFASNLMVHIVESQGILQASYKPGSSGSSGQMLMPAAAVYVKVFARDTSGDEWFYKDGYTDLRGKFDYVTLTSTADMSRVSRFSLLVASPELGAVMQQAAPPPR